MIVPEPATRGALTTVARRHVALTALRWLPTGMLVPVVVVLMQARGLSLADVGLVAAVQGAVVLVLELPTGGLADVLGRRPVLIVASLVDLLSLAVLAVAHSPGAFMVAWAVQGVYRALESGPLDAWYVDASQAIDPRADIEAGLARAGVATGAALGAGALLAAGVTTWPPVAGVDPLVLPVVGAMVARAVDITALARLMPEPRHRRAGALGTLRQSLTGVPGVVARTVRIVARSRALAALAAVEVSWGAGLVAVELFSAPRLVDLVGDATGAVATFALAVAAGWAVAAIGSAVTGRMTVLAGGSPARVGAWLRIVQGAMLATMALVGGPAALVAGYLAFYLVHGTANAVHYGMVHRLVGADERTTAVSAQSLATQAGAIIGAVLLGSLGDGAGMVWAMLAGAAVLAVAAPLYRIAGRSSSASPVRGGPHAEAPARSHAELRQQRVRERG